jgi:PAS domain S-box-containing protein
MKLSHRVFPAAAVVGLCIASNLVVDQTARYANQRRLDVIQRSYVPALELSRATQTGLLDLDRRLHDAAATSSFETLRADDEDAIRLAQTLRETEPNAAFHSGERAALESKLKQYYAAARNTSLRLMLGETEDSLRPARERTTSQSDNLRVAFDAVTARQTSEMNAALEENRAAHRRAVRSGAAILLGGLLVLALSGAHALATSAIKSARARKARALGGVGRWEWDAATSETTWSPELYDILGMGAGERARLTTLFERVHSDDQTATTGMVGLSFATEAPYRRRMRVLRADGAVRTVIVHNEICTDETGAVTGYRGLVQDVTSEALAAAAA